MSKFFEDTMQGLLELVEIEKGTIPVKERKGMAAPTYCVADESSKPYEKGEIHIHGQRKTKISQIN